MKFALGPKVVSPFVFARGLASYMMAERATPLPFSPEKVEKAREAINILSSLSLPGSSPFPLFQEKREAE